MVQYICAPVGLTFSQDRWLQAEMNPNAAAMCAVHWFALFASAIHLLASLLLGVGDKENSKHTAANGDRSRF